MRYLSLFCNGQQVNHSLWRRPCVPWPVLHAGNCQQLEILSVITYARNATGTQTHLVDYIFHHHNNNGDRSYPTNVKTGERCYYLLA